MLMLDRRTLELLAVRGLKGGGGPKPPKSPMELDTPLYVLAQADPEDTVFTATRNMRVLCMNTMIRHEAGQPHVTSSTTTTTGTKINELVMTTNYDDYGTTRDATTVVSLVDLVSGDTLTMTNDSRTSYVTKNRMIWLADNTADIGEVLYDTVRDNSAHNSRELEYDNSNIYMTYVHQSSASNSQVSANIEVVEGTMLDSYKIKPNNNNVIASVICKNPSDIICTTADVSNYVSKLFAVIKLVPR